MQYVLYIIDDCFTIYSDKKMDGALQTLYWKDTTLIDAFISQLSDKDALYIVLDLIDEELNFEWVPKVMPWEKGPLLKRRLQKAKVDNVALIEMRANHGQRKNKEGRKEESILTMTVNNTFNLRGFLAKLERSSLILNAIYTKPFLMKHYVERYASILSLPKNFSKFPLLITSRQSQFTYRQTFIFNGHLRLSRMVELDRLLSSPLAIQDALLKETRMAVSYIYNQKILPHQSPFAMLFVDSDPEVIQDLEKGACGKQLILEDWKKDEYFFATRLFKDLMTKEGYCQQAEEANACYSEQAMVDYIFTEKPKGFYQTDYTRKIQTILSSRQGLVWANTLMVLGLVGYLLINSVDTFLNWQELEMLDERLSAHQVEKNRLESLVQLKDDAQTIKSSVEFSEAILKLKLGGRLVGFDIEMLSEVFAKHDNIQISNIDWTNKERFDSGLFEMEFNGWVYPFYGTYQKPVARVDALVKDLQAVPGVASVNLIKEPLNRNLNQAVTINADEAEQQALPFSITLRLKHGQSK